MDQRVWKNRPKVGKHVPSSHGNLPKLHFVHYSSRWSRFSEAFASIVLNRPNKDFSRAAFSYFSLPHFQTYSWASHSYRGDSLEQNNLHSSQLTGPKQSFQGAFFCAEICSISAQNSQCLHKSLHQNQTKKARKCDKAHVATKALNQHITVAFSRQKSTLFFATKPKRSINNCFNF